MSSHETYSRRIGQFDVASVISHDGGSKYVTTTFIENRPLPPLVIHTTGGDVRGLLDKHVEHQIYRLYNVFDPSNASMIEHIISLNGYVVFDNSRMVRVSNMALEPDEQEDIIIKSTYDMTPTELAHVRYMAVRKAFAFAYPQKVE